MSLNYSISKTLQMLIDSIVSYPMMQIIIICSLLLIIILMINKKRDKYIVLAINLLIITLILLNYHDGLFSAKLFSNFIHNIYFYFLNSIIYFTVMIISYFRIENKSFLHPFYLISIILITFSLFMTIYMKNNHLIVLGNIYPMIVIGNYLYFIFYIYLIIKITVFFDKEIVKCYN